MVSDLHYFAQKIDSCKSKQTKRRYTNQLLLMTRALDIYLTNRTVENDN